MIQCKHPGCEFPAYANDLCLMHQGSGFVGDETPPVPEGGTVTRLTDAAPEGYVPWVQEQGAKTVQDGILTMIGHGCVEGDIFSFNFPRPWYVRLWHFVIRKKPQEFEVIAVTGSTVVFKEFDK